MLLLHNEFCTRFHFLVSNFGSILISCCLERHLGYNVLWHIYIQTSHQQAWNSSARFPFRLFPFGTLRTVNTGTPPHSKLHSRTNLCIVVRHSAHNKLIVCQGNNRSYSIRTAEFQSSHKSLFLTLYVQLQPFIQARPAIPVLQT